MKLIGSLLSLLLAFAVLAAQVVLLYVGAGLLLDVAASPIGWIHTSVIEQVPPGDLSAALFNIVAASCALLLANIIQKLRDNAAS